MRRRGNGGKSVDDVPVAVRVATRRAVDLLDVAVDGRVTLYSPLGAYSRIRRRARAEHDQGAEALYQFAATTRVLSPTGGRALHLLKVAAVGVPEHGLVNRQEPLMRAVDHRGRLLVADGPDVGPDDVPKRLAGFT